jgi:hypothetical protein
LKVSGLVIKWKFFETFGVGNKMKFFGKIRGCKKMKLFESFGVGKKIESFFESFGVGKKMKFF